MSRLPHALLWASYHFGGPALWDVVHGGDVKILMYHGIPSRAKFEGVANYYGYNIPVRDFELQLEYLKRHCNVVSLADLRAGRGLSKKKTNVILTFDDGYEDNYSNAFQLLARHRMPAVFALPTAFVCDREPLWNDIIEYAVNQSRQQRVQLRWDGVDREFVLAAADGRLGLYNWLMRESIRVDQDRRDALIGSAIEALDVPVRADDIFQNADYRPLTRAQITEMAQTGLIEFASHSIHHYALSKLNTEAKRAELRESKRQIEAWTGSTCSTFCVPGGAYNVEVLDEAFSAGYELVLTSDFGNAAPGRRVQNRVGVLHKESIHKFADVVHGPVMKVLGATRRVRSRLRNRLSTAGTA